MSRPKRWAKLVSRIAETASELDSMIDDLESLQEEYQEWRGNLPESLEESTVAEKLDAVAEVDLRTPFDDLITAIGEAESTDLPLGFGRD